MILNFGYLLYIKHQILTIWVLFFNNVISCYTVIFYLVCRVEKTQTNKIQINRLLLLWSRLELLSVRSLFWLIGERTEKEIRRIGWGRNDFVIYRSISKIADKYPEDGKFKASIIKSSARGVELGTEFFNRKLYNSVRQYFLL